MAAKIYTTKDAPIAPLKKKTLAVIGFGSQGHAHALNLKDSGMKVIVGLYPKSKSREVAKKLGFEVMDTAEAVKAADVIFVATPDTVIPSVYNKDIAPHLTKGKTLLFSHGFAVHFKTITCPTDVDVILVAPKGTWSHRAFTVREWQRRPRPHRDPSGRFRQGQTNRARLGRWRRLRTCRCV